MNICNTTKKHPVFTCAEDLSLICKPLQQLNITYFAHAYIDKQNTFSGLATNPKFIEHYLRNKYYNMDIHLVNEHHLGEMILWDSLSVNGDSEKMDREAAELGVRHSFTIVERNPSNRKGHQHFEGTSFYHFSTHLESNQINQVYLSNLDILKQFILYFKNVVGHSKQLMSAYDFKFCLEENAKFTCHELDSVDKIQPIRNNLMELFQINNANQHTTCHNTNDRESVLHPRLNVFHKEEEASIYISPHLYKCLSYLLQGYSAKEIARLTLLSNRTVEHYMANLRKILNCRTSKEIIAQYYIEK